MAFPLYKSTIQSCMEYCCYVWACVPNCYMDMFSKIQRQVCRTVGPTLKASHLSLANIENVADSSLIYRYHFGMCFSELAELVQLLHAHGRFNFHSNQLHDLSVTIAASYKNIVLILPSFMVFDIHFHDSTYLLFH